MHHLAKSKCYESKPNTWNMQRTFVSVADRPYDELWWVRIREYDTLRSNPIAISCVMIANSNTCLIIIIKSEVWIITRCLGLGHETLVCDVCLSIFLWICDMAALLRGTFLYWWYSPRIWPSVTDMQVSSTCRNSILMSTINIWYRVNATIELSIVVLYLHDTETNKYKLIRRHHHCQIVQCVQTIYMYIHIYPYIHRRHARLRLNYHDISRVCLNARFPSYIQGVICPMSLPHWSTRCNYITRHSMTVAEMAFINDN